MLESVAMPESSTVTRRYLAGDYAARNPHWDAEDAPWKAAQVLGILARHNLHPRRIVEVGCGAGAVLAELRRSLADTELSGFDIAPDAAKLWSNHSWAKIHFVLGDFLSEERQDDLVLLLDVVEHLENPFLFLERLRTRAPLFVFHFPLDLSASSVLRENPLLAVREKVGHIHYFSRGLVLALLTECGYEVLEASYTGAGFSAPQRTWKTRFAGVVRSTMRALGTDFAVRLLGGETLIVLARPKANG